MTRAGNHQQQSGTVISLDRVPVAVRSEAAGLGYFSASLMTMEKRLEYQMIEFATELLAENLGEEEIVQQHRGTAEFVGFATWWDHWKATYRNRWWMQ